MKSVRFLNLAVKEREKELIHNKIDEIMTHGQIVLGSDVNEFENNIANYCSRKYATGVGSGSDAVFLALSALDIKTGDEVITTSLSWIATANAISLTGATPVFADIDDDLNISVSSVNNLITPRTKAILAVDYTGKLANAKSLIDLCGNNDLYLIEDGSQAFGAVRDNIICGSYGIVSAISHNPMKVLAALGEAGSVLTDDASIKERLDSLRYNGTVNKEFLKKPSINGRIDTVQAAILNLRLESFNDLISKRNNNARLYSKFLNCDYIQTPQVTKDETHVFYTYTILAENRDELKQFLADKNIECKIQHPILMSEQEPFKNCKSETQNANNLRNKILSIPVNESLDDEDIFYVSESINEFYRG